MHFEKSTCELYRIFSDGEWATICVSEYPVKERDGTKTYGGEILVHSSFGNYAQGWTTCSTPFKEFLAGLNFAYLMGKLMGTEAKVYDKDATYQNVLKQLDSLVQDGSYSEADRTVFAEALESEVLDSIGTEFEFVNAMRELGESGPDDVEGDIEYLTDDAHQYITTKVNPQATGFWNELWPAFAAALRQEAVAQAA